MYLFEFFIANTHPCLAGHFSGNPIVPGVIIIDEVISGLYIKNKAVEVTDISSLKFLSPLKPDITVKVIISEKKTNLLKFICSIDGNNIVDGLLRIQKATEK